MCSYAFLSNISPSSNLTGLLSTRQRVNRPTYQTLPHKKPSMFSPGSSPTSHHHNKRSWPPNTQMLWCTVVLILFMTIWATSISQVQQRHSKLPKTYSRIGNELLERIYDSISCTAHSNRLVPSLSSSFRMKDLTSDPDVLKIAINANAQQIDTSLPRWVKQAMSLL